MAKFSVKLLAAAGSREIELEARDEQDARRRGSTSGRVIAVKRVRSFGARSLNFSDRQMFLSRLTAMVSSGVGVGEALRLIHATFTGSIKSVAHELLLKVEAGASLAEAMEQVGKPSFPEEVCAMIKAGSHSGTTATALRDTMNFEREVVQIKKASSGGIWSATAGFLTGAAVIFGTVFWIMPKMMGSDMMKMGGMEGDMAMIFSIGKTAGYAMAGIMTVFLIFVLVGTVGRRIAPIAIDALILRIPVYKDFILARSNFISFYALSMLVGTGVRLENAFSLMARTTPAGRLRRDFSQASDAVRKGRSWAAEMSSIHPTDRAALASSLDRDQVARAFSAMSESYRTLYASRTETLVLVLQTISMLSLIVAGLVSFAPMIPMMKMTTSMSM